MMLVTLDDTLKLLFDGVVSLGIKGFMSLLVCLFTTWLLNDKFRLNELQDLLAIEAEPCKDRSTELSKLLEFLLLTLHLLL